MKSLSLVLVTLLSFVTVGCKKKGGDCATAIDHSMELAKADMAKMPGTDEKMLGKMRDLGLQHCKEDKWSDEAVSCMIAAKTEAEAQACYGKLSTEQQEKMNKSVMDMATGGGTGSAAAGSAAAGSAAGSATTGSGSAMAGSDTGSAAAGSGSAAAGSASGSDAAAAPGARNWNCKKACKLALDCKSKALFHDLKECVTDCENLAKDKDGRYERGAAMGPTFYECIDKATDCAGIHKCDK